jgi:hypothetical protein
VSSRIKESERLAAVLNEARRRVPSTLPAVAFTSFTAPRGSQLLVRSQGTDLDEDWIRDVAAKAEEFVWTEIDRIRPDVLPGAIAGLERKSFGAIKDAGAQLIGAETAERRGKNFLLLVEELTNGNTGADSPAVSVSLPSKPGEQMIDTLLRLAALACLAGLVAYIIRRGMDSDRGKLSAPVPAPGAAPHAARSAEPGGAFAVVWMSGSMKSEDLECLRAADAEKKLTAEALEIVKHCYKSRYLKRVDLDKLRTASAGEFGPMADEQALPGYLVALIDDDQRRFANYGDRFGPPLRTALKAAVNEPRPPSFEVHFASAKTVDEFGFVVV